MLYSCRSYEKEAEARLGVSEAVTHRVVHPFTTYFEREGLRASCIHVTSVLI